MPTVHFEVDRETAKQMIDDIEQAVEDGEEDWEFRGDFSLSEAIQLRNSLLNQLDGQ